MFSKVPRQIIQKLIVLLNTCNKQSKNENTETIPLIIASKRIVKNKLNKRNIKHSENY